MRQYWRERKKRERYSEMMKERGGWEMEGELCTVKMGEMGMRGGEIERDRQCGDARWQEGEGVV